MEIRHISHEVYAVALDYEGIPRPEVLEDCHAYYSAETSRRAWTDGGLEKALADYLTCSGGFAEGGEFEEVNGIASDLSKEKHDKINP